MAKSVQTKLCEIASKKQLTEADKAYVVEQSAALGVVFKPTACRDCYRDQAIILWRMVVEQSLPKTRRYLLRVGTDLIFRGVRVNNTRSDAELQGYLEEGLPRRFYKRIAGEEV